MSVATPQRRATKPAPSVRRPPAIRPVAAASPTPARAPFVVLVLVLLSVGLGALLLLNTLLAQGSFTLHSLDARVAGLADREQALQQRAAELAAPQRLARSAARIGMVPSVNPAFLRTENGKILGEPVPAVSQAPVVGSEPAPVAGGGEAKSKPDSSDQSHEKKQTKKNGSSQGDQTSGGADR